MPFFSPSSAVFLLPFQFLLIVIGAVFIVLSQCCGCSKKKKNTGAPPPQPPTFLPPAPQITAAGPGTGPQFVPMNDPKYETLNSLDPNIFLKSASAKPPQKPPQATNGPKAVPVPANDPKYETLNALDPNIFVKK
ncbi:hypothetical protein niasHS_012520 [Heterodera schachtii]|uniref:Uncharacterized protein n=1 Tax=Heterodera schachtii TaxID=97005 RepID=A0ABD2IEM9_HETSC